jgi:hypothetical protein
LSKPHRVSSPPAGNARYYLWISVLILIAAIRIASTYTVFTQTYDEAEHAGCGVLWWSERTFCVLETPPFARIFEGLGPWLMGANPRLEAPSFHATFVSTGDYFRAAAWARAGVLPFFVLASVFVALWSWRLHGRRTAVLATLLFTTLAPVLGHAGLATSDMAAAAMFVSGLYVFYRWLDSGTWSRTLALGILTGLALVTKFSLAAFAVPAVALILVLKALDLRLTPFGSLRAARSRLAQIAAIAVVGALSAWAIYWFSFATLPPNAGELEHLPWPMSAIRDYGIVHPIPAPELFLGLAQVHAHQLRGHFTYLMGQVGTNGWWYFFPVVFLIKTQIAFLILIVLAIPLLARQPDRRYVRWIPLGIAMSVMVLSMFAHINLGVRHILPVYPFLAVSAGFAASRMISQSRPLLKYGCIVLLAWHAGSAALAHPDYFPYFNEAVVHPEHWRWDSDLDWGQDVGRLAKRLQELNVNETIAYACSGSNKPEWFGIRSQPLVSDRFTGWLAASYSVVGDTTALALTGAKPDLRWLDSHKPVAHVGRSIVLYYIPPQ